MLSRILKTIIISTVLASGAVFGQSNSEASLALPPSDGPVKVQFSFKLQNINAIDDETETFEFSGITTLVWQDPRQSFDPADAGCVEKIYNGSYQFNEVSPAWYPQLLLANAVGPYEGEAVLLRIKPDGTCVLSEMINAVAKTRFGFEQYPYDAQQLEALFEILGFNADEVVLEVGPLSGFENGMLRVPVPQWELHDITMARLQEEGASPSSVVMTVNVRRKWVYLARLVVFPLLAICLLSWSVFWMERSSLGDRMSVSFVGILTAVAYQTLIGDILPQIAYVTLIHAYLNISFWGMCAPVVINLVVGAHDKKGNHQLGDKIDRRCRWAFPLAYVLLLVCAVIILPFL